MSKSAVMKPVKHRFLPLIVKKMINDKCALKFNIIVETLTLTKFNFSELH